MAWLLLLGDYQYSYPFLQPLPAWNYWYLFLFPLCAAIAIVYKATRLPDLRRVPREAAVIFIWILVGMGAGAALLAGLVTIMQRI